MMLRRTPMARGKGFKRPERPPRAPAVLRPVSRPGVITSAASMAKPQPKDDIVVHEGYRRLVRQMPCIRCGIVGFTQFAHTDLGKGMGLKTDDRGGWPGCGPHGDSNGCHHHVGREMSREERRAFEEDAAARTREKIEAAGLWPKSLPRWPAAD